MNSYFRAVLDCLRRAGLVLRVERGVLRVSPRNKVTPELQALIDKNRDALIAHLQSHRTATTSARRLAELKAADAAAALIERIRAEVRSLPF